MKKTIKHDIFVSHSGKQKGFAKDLAARLSSEGYSVFFDQNCDSLPPGEDFPSHIFRAAHTCKLSLVLLCEGFVTSRWPLMELCSFVDRRVSVPTFTILPIFFKLSPSDLKAQENVRKWKIEWERFERENKRISAAKCEEAVTNVLPRLSGVSRRLESEQGEASYMDDIIKRIYSILPPRVLSLHRYGAGPDKPYVGMERLSQIILHKFAELEDPHSDSETEGNYTNGCMLGMHGVSGSGKSTLCNFLCNFMFDEFMGKVIHLELPTVLRGDDDPRIKEQYAKLLSTISPHRRDTYTFASMDLVTLYNLLLGMGTHDQFSQKTFLVLDNISPSNYSSYERIVKAILMSGVLGSGSRIMLVAQSSVILENLVKEVTQRYRYAIIEIPCLTKAEAMEVIRQNRYPSVEEDVIPHLLDKCSFPSSSFMYVPFVFEQIGVLLRRKCRTEYLKELELLCKMVNECKKEAIRELMDINFKRLPEDLQVLLFDIALFIIPAGYSALKDATPILCSMHGMADIDAFKLEWKMKELMEHCALSVTDDKKLSVHDIYAEYARSIPGNSRTYVDERCLSISDAPTMFSIRLHLKYWDASTICIDSRGHYDQEMCLHVKAGDSSRALPLDIRLHVEVGARTRALVVRNSREYSKCILILSGDSSSLVCLRTENVQLSCLLPSRSQSPLSNLVRVDIINANAKGSQMKARSGQHGRWMNSILNLVSDQIQNSIQSMTWLAKPNFLWEQCITTYNQRVLKGFGFAKQMTRLRVLILENAGIRRLEIPGRSFPVLGELKVYGKSEEPIDITIDTPPKLESLIAGAYFTLKDPPRFVRTVGSDCSWRSRKLTLQLGECPHLEDIFVDGSFHEVKVVGLLPSSLRYLYVADDRCPQFMPSKLITASINRLTLLKRLELSCKKVESLNLTRRGLGCLPCLERIWLTCCDSLTHLSVEPGCMPDLVDLEVYWCGKLEAIEGIEHIALMEQLQRLSLRCLPQLKLECVWKGSSCEEASSTRSRRRRQLKYIDMDRCPGVKFDWDVLMTMMVQASESMSLMALTEVGIMRSLASSQAVPLDRFTIPEGRFTQLTYIGLCRLDHLQEIEGFQHLPNLECLLLEDLPHLAGVSGTLATSIKQLTIASCPMLLEIPPLGQMPQLRFLSCSQCARLKRVEGRFREMKKLESVEFVGCESMEAFPMEDAMNELLIKSCEEDEAENRTHLQVYGSKFAMVDVMQTWLRDAEWGSPLWKAALETLILQGALDALRDYLSALVLEQMTEVDWVCFHNLFHPQYAPPLFIVKETWEPKPEVELFVEWFCNEFPQLVSYLQNTFTQLEI